MSDLDCYDLPKIARRWLSDSSFEQSAAQMGIHLNERGYTNRTIVSYVSCIAHLAHWAEAESLQIFQVSPTVIERFVYRHLPICCCTSRCQRSVNTVRAAVAVWQSVAFSNHLVKQVPDNLTPSIRSELTKFRHYLNEIRGLQPSTCDTRLQHVGDFLSDRFTDQSVSIEQLKPTDLADYILQLTKGWKPASVKVVCGALSSYLRFKAIHGVPTIKLVAALPKVAQWRQASLPKGLSSDEINTLLNSFDQSTLGGQRDYAIARCYIDLGLRTAEIVRLTLDDIDWVNGVLHIRSKGTRVDALPLPKATGEAITYYLKNRDNRHATRALFLRLHPPFDRGVTADTIRGSIRNAAKRCGLSGRLTGPHKLRHTLATCLVNSGVSLKEISDLMRHRDLNTTTIYAKVDMKALSAVISAWPGKFS